ncbi:putative HIT-like protein [Seiridium cardinale]
MASATSAKSLCYTGERLFTGKLDMIEKRWDAFWALPYSKDDVLAYLRNERDHRWAIDLRENPKWIQPNNIFRNYKGPILAEGRDAFLLGNARSYHVGQELEKPERAGMSMIHILAIPKLGFFNGVSLNAENVSIIDDMIALFKLNWEKEEFRKSVLGHQLNTVDEAAKHRLEALNEHESGSAAARQSIMEAHDLATRCLRWFEEDVLKATYEDFQFGLHLFPQQSISHLHMHIVLTPWRFRQFSTFANDKKTVDALELRDFVKTKRDDPNHPSMIQWETKERL